MKIIQNNFQKNPCRTLEGVAIWMKSWPMTQNAAKARSISPVYMISSVAVTDREAKKIHDCSAMEAKCYHVLTLHSFMSYISFKKYSIKIKMLEDLFIFLKLYSDNIKKTHTRRQRLNFVDAYLCSEFLK